MLDKVVSGGQTGADQAALHAARSAGIPTGGRCPLGWLTEDGPAPWLESFGLVELATADYRARTEQNVRDADAVLWFGRTDTPGAKTTIRAAAGMGKPVMLVEPGRGARPSDVAAWLARGLIQPGMTLIPSGIL